MLARKSLLILSASCCFVISLKVQNDFKKLPALSFTEDPSTKI